jgi:transposase-like protein
MHEVPVRRQRFTPAERARLLVSYRQSGLTQRKFAQLNKLSVSCLRQWLRKFKPEVAIDAPPSFMQLPGGLPLAEVSRASYKILFAGGQSLDVCTGFRAEELAQICQILHRL